MSKRVKCPNCGLYHYIEDEVKANTFESSYKRPYRSEAASLSLPQSQGYRETPAYLPSVETHVKVPLFQSVVPALLLSPGGIILGIGMAATVASSTKSDLTGFGIFVSGLGGGALVFCTVSFFQWFKRLGVYDALLWQFEEIAQMDLDGDSQIGEPLASRVEVELRRNGLPWKFESFEISQDRLIKLARAVANGQSFSERTASDCGIPREEFNSLRDKFISRGLAEWKGSSPTQGVRLTDDGLDTIAEIATTPLPRASRSIGENRGYSTHAPTPTQINGNNYERFEPIGDL